MSHDNDRSSISARIIVYAVTAMSLLLASLETPCAGQEQTQLTSDLEIPQVILPAESAPPPISSGSPTTPQPNLISQVEGLVQPSQIGSSLKIILTMSVISLAPAILLMTTSFIRISIVLGLLRQALGAQQLPPNQVTTSLSLFMTLMIMWPIWTRVYEDAIEPYSDPTVENDDGRSVGSRQRTGPHVHD